jgi:hypothetical protein
MSSNLVTVAQYRSQISADVARLALANAGIEAFVHDTNVSTINIFWRNAVGWVKLQVPDDRAAEARELLEASPGLLWQEHDEAAQTSDDICLACGQAMPPPVRRCPACGWSFLDQPVPEAEAIEEEAEEN